MGLPIIESVEAFSKTQVYQSLRKGQLSDEELLNEYSNAVKVRSNPMYKRTCFDELDKRGLIEHEVIDSDTV